MIQPKEDRQTWGEPWALDLYHASPIAVYEANCQTH